MHDGEAIGQLAVLETTDAALLIVHARRDR